MKPNDAAFPPGGGYTGGLTKREWLAGLAMQAVLSRVDFHLFPGHEDQGLNASLASRNAFRIADAMIAESEEGQ